MDDVAPSRQTPEWGNRSGRMSTACSSSLRANRSGRGIGSSSDISTTKEGAPFPTSWQGISDYARKTRRLITPAGFLGRRSSEWGGYSDDAAVFQGRGLYNGTIGEVVEIAFAAFAIASSPKYFGPVSRTPDPKAAPTAPIGRFPDFRRRCSRLKIPLAPSWGFRPGRSIP